MNKKKKKIYIYKNMKQTSNNKREQYFTIFVQLARWIKSAKEINNNRDGSKCPVTYFPSFIYTFSRFRTD